MTNSDLIAATPNSHGQEPLLHVEIGEDSAGVIEITDAPSTRKRFFNRHPFVVWLAVGWIALVVVLGVTADFLPIADPTVDVDHGVRTEPFQSWDEPFGTDRLGRSELSRVIYGARVSIVASVAAAAIALSIGAVVGISSGYFRGKYDAATGVMMDSVLAFPGIMLLLILAAVLGPGVSTVIIGLSALGWVSFGRLTRASTLQASTSDYVAAARGLGAKTRTVLFRELFPNVMLTVAALAPLVIGGLILAEASLSFLGLGVPPPKPSWGNMINEARSDIRESPYLLLVPSIALFVTIYAVNTLGDYLRTRSDAASRL